MECKVAKQIFAISIIVEPDETLFSGPITNENQQINNTKYYESW